MQSSSTADAVRWLHVPKSGSAFINVLARYACDALPADANFTMAHSFEQWRSEAAAAAAPSPPCPRLLSPWTGHAPARPDEVQPGRRHRVLVALFRRPSQRLLSGFHHVEAGMQRMIAPGMTPPRRAEMQRAVARSGAGASTYARWPGIAGCATKMLLGLPCSLARTLRPANVSRAVMLVRERLRFVGLTEEWERSVCLFHALLRPAAREPVHATELARTHVGAARPTRRDGAAADYDERALRGFVDRQDEQVYAAARRRFADDLRRVRTCGLIESGERARSATEAGRARAEKSGAAGTAVAALGQP